MFGLFKKVAAYSFKCYPCCEWKQQRNKGYYTSEDGYKDGRNSRSRKERRAIKQDTLEESMEAHLRVGACYYPAQGEVDLWWWGDENEACLEGIKVTPAQGERIARTVPPCVQIPALVGIEELRPNVEDVPLEEALATMVHVMQVGWKPFFNGQRINDCIASVRRLARLGASVEAHYNTTMTEWYLDDKEARLLDGIDSGDTARFCYEIEQIIKGGK